MRGVGRRGIGEGWGTVLSNSLEQQNWVIFV